jgi:hypothetical protein
MSYLRASASSILATVIFTVLVIIAYDQIAQRRLTADLTTIAKYSLSPDSRQVIEMVKAGGRPIRITAFYGRQYLRQREAANIILRQYDSAGDDLTRNRCLPGHSAITHWRIKKMLSMSPMWMKLAILI